jgi:ParB family transcriptional regulator, chromosome partitioning protein
MHPADEFDAFKALIDGGKGVEDVAARFGVSVLTVQRRLKLAALSPKLLVLYRRDGVNLDQLMALALSDDHGAQERTWFDAQPWDRTPCALRQRLTAGEIEAAGSALVRFVGIDRYEAAGGVVRRDLFDDEQSRFVSDRLLLERLATEKLQALAAAVLEEGWLWAQARLELDSKGLRQFAAAAHTVREPTAAERSVLDELDKRSAELDQQSQALREAPAWSVAEAEVIALEEQDIDARRKAVQDGLKCWTPATKALAGVIVSISREGDAEVIRGLVREADRKALAAAARSTGGASDGAVDNGNDPSLASVDKAARTAPAESEALTRRLAAHKTVAVQAMLVKNAPVAVAALTHGLVLRVFADDIRPSGSAMQLAPRLSALAVEAAADDIKQSRGWKVIDEAKQAWRVRLPEQQGEWLRWLIRLPQAELIDLLALCCALTVNTLPAAGSATDANAIAAALDLDMADWWEPTAQGYLQHLPKAQIIQALKEAGPELAREGVELMKKEVLVNTAASRLAGRRWLPVQWRRSAV